ISEVVDWGVKEFLKRINGELAQLVQSICLTSRGSLVRIQYSPPIILRRLSSAGSEHLPYKQRVTGSNPVASTLHMKSIKKLMLFCFIAKFIMFTVYILYSAALDTYFSNQSSNI